MPLGQALASEDCSPPTAFPGPSRNAGEAGMRLLCGPWHPPESHPQPTLLPYVGASREVDQGLGVACGADRDDAYGWNTIGCIRMRSLAAIGEMNKERSYPMCFGQCECESGSACVAGLAHADETVSIPHLKGDQNRRRGRIGSKRTAQTATIEVRPVNPRPLCDASRTKSRRDTSQSLSNYAHAQR